LRFDELQYTGGGDSALCIHVPPLPLSSPRFASTTAVSAHLIYYIIIYTYTRIRATCSTPQHVLSPRIIVCSDLLNTFYIHRLHRKVRCTCIYIYIYIYIARHVRGWRYTGGVWLAGGCVIYYILRDGGEFSHTEKRARINLHRVHRNAPADRDEYINLSAVCACCGRVMVAEQCRIPIVSTCTIYIYIYICGEQLARETSCPTIATN